MQECLEAEESCAARCASCHNAYYHTLFWNWVDVQAKQTNLL